MRTNMDYSFLFKNMFGGPGTKAADPSWKPGKPIPAGALDGITRESIDKSLVKTRGEYGETFARGINANA